MPVSIYKRHESEDLLLVSLGDGEWSLPIQMGLLESWMDANSHGLPSGEYVADLGFCWRRDAAGGGTALDTGFLKKMADAGFTLFLSEYPGFADGQGDMKDACPHQDGGALQ